MFMGLFGEGEGAGYGECGFGFGFPGLGAAEGEVSFYAAFDSLPAPAADRPQNLAGRGGSISQEALW